MDPFVEDMLAQLEAAGVYVPSRDDRPSPPPGSDLPTTTSVEAGLPWDPSAAWEPPRPDTTPTMPGPGAPDYAGGSAGLSAPAQPDTGPDWGRLALTLASPVGAGLAGLFSGGGGGGEAMPGESRDPNLAAARANPDTGEGIGMPPLGNAAMAIDEGFGGGTNYRDPMYIPGVGRMPANPFLDAASNAAAGPGPMESMGGMLGAASAPRLPAPAQRQPWSGFDTGFGAERQDPLSHWPDVIRTQPPPINPMAPTEDYNAQIRAWQAWEARNPRQLTNLARSEGLPRAINNNVPLGEIPPALGPGATRLYRNTSDPIQAANWWRVREDPELLGTRATEDPMIDRTEFPAALAGRWASDNPGALARYAGRGGTSTYVDVPTPGLWEMRPDIRGDGGLGLAGSEYILPPEYLRRLRETSPGGVNARREWDRFVAGWGPEMRDRRMAGRALDRGLTPDQGEFERGRSFIQGRPPPKSPEEAVALGLPWDPWASKRSVALSTYVGAVLPAEGDWRTFIRNVGRRGGLP
jgi:hypothetical protein